MPIDLPIDNVPDGVVERLKQRAAKNGRSLEEELLAIFIHAAEVDSLSPIGTSGAGDEIICPDGDRD